MNSDPDKNNNKRSRIHETGRKISALSFVGLILSGNFWVICAFTGKPAPEALYFSFLLFSGAAFSGGLMIGLDWVRRRISGDESAGTCENTNDER